MRLLRINFWGQYRQKLCLFLAEFSDLCIWKRRAGHIHWKNYLHVLFSIKNVYKKCWIKYLKKESRSYSLNKLSTCFFHQKYIQKILAPKKINRYTLLLIFSFSNICFRLFLIHNIKYPLICWKPKKEKITDSYWLPTNLNNLVTFSFYHIVSSVFSIWNYKNGNKKRKKETACLYTKALENERKWKKDRNKYRQQLLNI